MSRFAGQGRMLFGGMAESSSEEEESSGEEVEEVKEEVKTQKRGYLEISSDSDDEERVFKTGQQKKDEAFQKILDDTHKHCMNDDFNQIEDDMVKLDTEIKKASEVIYKEGEKLRSKILKCFMELEDTINAIDNAAKKKMNKNNATAYNKVKQKFKKYM
jgi:hypothetical protein